MLLFYHLQSILYNSTKTKDFTRLYLDVTTITGSYCHLAGNGEDDISLSSVDEDDNDSVSEDYTEENKKNHQNDISVIAQQSTDVEHGEEVVVDLTSSPSSGRQQQPGPTYLQQPEHNMPLPGLCLHLHWQSHFGRDGRSESQCTPVLSNGKGRVTGTTTRLFTYLKGFLAMNGSNFTPPNLSFSF